MVSALGTSCLRDKCDATREYIQFNPVYMTGTQLNYDITTVSDKALVNPGKIYFYKNYLFINEQGEGVHVYNNENPAAPVHETFYNIPGNFDIAIKDDILFADNPLYLLTIDISTITNPQLKTRERLKDYDWLYDNLDYQHVIYYTRSNIVESFDCSDSNWGQQIFRRNDNIFVDFASDFDGNVITNESTGSNGNSGSGVGGSFARFTIYDNYLYTVDESSLNVWDISQSMSPEKISSKHLGWGIETIFPYKTNLFIGSTAGMFIFDNSDPANPVQTSTFRHAQACDPVVVSGDKAYVTLRDGTECNGFENQLDVLDVSNINNPTLIKSYDMKHPHGLAIRDNDLFICEGSYGLKVFDASDDQKITSNELAHLDNINAYDVISISPEVLFLIGSDGFFQYNVTDAKNPKLISSILVQK
ncbi:hypothetical protein GCM10007940_35480 [Portibacter lacus]|uniref:LVIVD repeat-containing protein n=2 Tax=Portibacter lacus TaxID=1099794 RepID=A0AA37SRK7_9BACT|nr:hypothetical protein GCM10007940_35480 [Portibacter lacus]